MTTEQRAEIICNTTGPWDSKTLGGSWKRGIVNPDLEEERKNLSFDTDELQKFFYTEPMFNFIKEMNELCAKHPELYEGLLHKYELTREEIFDLHWKRIHRLMELKPEIFLGHDYKKFWYIWSNYFADVAHPVAQHQLMFCACIDFLGSEEQKAEWFEPARRMNMVGCYAQTELGHGSFVPGIETTATLDMKTDEFIIHTPHVKAAKYWPGQMAMGTHAILFARVIVDENDYGVWPFMVQLRSLEDHMPLPGIEIGDVGAKLGFNMIDNGYGIFTHVRIPRTNLLSRFV